MLNHLEKLLKNKGGHLKDVFNNMRRACVNALNESGFINIQDSKQAPDDEWEFTGNVGRGLMLNLMDSWAQKGISDQMKIGEPRANGGMSEDQLWNNFVGTYQKKQPAGKNNLN